MGLGEGIEKKSEDFANEVDPTNILIMVNLI